MLHYDIRQRLEEREEHLSPYAAKSRLSRGRQHNEEPCPMRTEFQRDRDRIIHCKAFRRLKHKTQVFIAPLGDHYVTRLTHTLEVSQIARSIARALNLNEDLAEAISLGHDLGHTPFGHVGEDMLDHLYPEGFRHNEQSLRVVDLLERDGQGLNLTWEVRDGILKHSKSGADILSEEWGSVDTLEGEVCKIADIVAYINHDIGDAVRAGIISDDVLPRRAVAVLGSSHSERINTLVSDVINFSWAATGAEGGKPRIGMSPVTRKAANTLRRFLFEKVYNITRGEGERARETVRLLYQHLIDHDAELPDEYNLRNESVTRRVVDYIAGMTDNYALRMADELSEPGK
ncbi:MAG: deoxyguanosinetriphosphate triphosphohydrolase [Dehalococcoidia bacterium]|nr:deoxyguanosinetriphosphate triphosphohydrolase [Dehalococcoidia bacterium]